MPISIFYNQQILMEFKLEITKEEQIALELAGETLEEVIKIPYSIKKINLSEDFTLKEYRNTDIIAFLSTIYMFHSLDVNILALSMVYIERLYETVNIGPKNIHMVICISSMIAKKHLDDLAEMLAFSDMLNIKSKIIKRAEIEFLENINYRISVRETTFNKYRNMLNL